MAEFMQGMLALLALLAIILGGYGLIALGVNRRIRREDEATRECKVDGREDGLPAP